MEHSRVTPLKEKGTIFSGSRDKAEILNRQFTPVFIPEEPDCNSLQQPLDTLHIENNVFEWRVAWAVSGPSYPPLKDIVFSVKGVERLLSTIQPDKATGPD